MSGIDRIDVGDLLDGFAMGKAVHMADWHHRREQAEFRALCRRLVARNWRAKPPVQAKLIVKKRARRRAKLRAAAPVHTCRECGSQWCRAPGFNGATPRTFCGRLCKNAWHDARRDLGPPGRHCSVCHELGHNRQTCPAVVR